MMLTRNNKNWVFMKINLFFCLFTETREEIVCPGDSELTTSGECKCRSICRPLPSEDCFYKESSAPIGTPGYCCPNYECKVPVDGNNNIIDKYPLLNLIRGFIE